MEHNTPGEEDKWRVGERADRKWHGEMKTLLSDTLRHLQLGRWLAWSQPTPPPLLAQKIYPFLFHHIPRENPLIIIFRLYIFAKAQWVTGKRALRGGNNSWDAMRSGFIKASSSLMSACQTEKEGRWDELAASLCTVGSQFVWKTS